MHLCCKMGWARLSQRDIFSSHMHTGPQHRTAKELVIHLGHHTSSLQFMCCDLTAQTSPPEREALPRVGTRGAAQGLVTAREKTNERFEVAVNTCHSE